MSHICNKILITKYKGWNLEISTPPDFSRERNNDSMTIFPHSSQPHHFLVTISPMLRCLMTRTEECLLTWQRPFLRPGQTIFSRLSRALGSQKIHQTFKHWAPVQSQSVKVCCYVIILAQFALGCHALETWKTRFFENNGFHFFAFFGLEPSQLNFSFDSFEASVTSPVHQQGLATPPTATTVLVPVETPAVQVEVQWPNGLVKRWPSQSWPN